YMAQFMLRDYATDIATTPEEAIDKVLHHQYRVLLVDINLGADRSGIDLLHEMRGIEGYEFVPAVAVTAYALPGDEERFITEGFDNYVAKPFRKERLIEAVELALTPPPEDDTPKLESLLGGSFEDFDGSVVIGDDSFEPVTLDAAHDLDGDGAGGPHPAAGGQIHRPPGRDPSRRRRRRFHAHRTPGRGRSAVHARVHPRTRRRDDGSRGQPDRARPRRRTPAAGRAARLRQLGHDDAPARGRPRRAAVHVHAHRRRVALGPPDGPQRPAAPRDGRRESARRRPRARHRPRRRAARHRVRAARRVRPGQELRPPRRPLRRGPHDGHRDGALARSHRADARARRARARREALRLGRRRDAAGGGDVGQD